jgi:hypothetical protein
MHLDGQYDYNIVPIAPPGTIIIVYDTPSHRRNCAPHGQDGWYIGPALEHYRCYILYITKTHSDRIVETVELFPTEVTLSFVSTTYLATEAVKKLTHALLHPKSAGPFTQVGIEQTLALKCMVAIFRGALPKHRQTPLHQSANQ